MTGPSGTRRARGAAGGLSAVRTDLPPLRDRIKPGVRVLFVGINPGVRSALTGHHFAGFSNRFWPLLFESGLVPERLTFEHDDRLPEFGYGITNIVPRPTPGIDTLTPAEFVDGRLRLTRKIRRYRPAIVAMVGVTVLRAMFPARKDAVALGLQPERLGESLVFVSAEPQRQERELHLCGDAEGVSGVEGAAAILIDGADDARKQHAPGS